MSKLKFDLAQKGLLCVLKPYQVEIMSHFWDMQTPMDSRTVHNNLLVAEVEGARSRAAVINFMNLMVDEGILNYQNKTTKGGIKRVYRTNNFSKTRNHFRLRVADLFRNSIVKFLDADEG